MYIMEKEICRVILLTSSSMRDAQNIGITILDKYENVNTGLVPELREIAAYIQSLARCCVSQQDRADECYEVSINEALEKAATIAEGLYDKTYWDDPSAGIAAEIRKLNRR